MTPSRLAPPSLAGMLLAVALVAAVVVVFLLLMLPDAHAQEWCDGAGTIACPTTTTTTAPPATTTTTEAPIAIGTPLTVVRATPAAVAPSFTG